MGRPANSKSGKSLTVHAKTLSDEEKIRAFKELHARNPELQIKETIMECVNHFLAKHNWPPGNSQTLLQTFIGDMPKPKRKIYCVLHDRKTVLPCGEGDRCPNRRCEGQLKPSQQSGRS